MSYVVVFWTGFDGLLFGAGGGDGYGLLRGVIGELITISPGSWWKGYSLLVLISLQTSRDVGGV